MKQVYRRMILPVLLLPCAAIAQISYTGGAYTQDFNSLGSGTVWQPQTALPNGWTVSRGSYVWTSVTNGYSNNYGTYSFSSSADDPDKSIGLVIGTTGPASIYARFRNDTGTALTSFTLQYFVEQWAIGATTASNQVIRFRYSVNHVGGVVPAFSNAPALNMASIHDGDGTFAALNGNETTNRISVSNTVAGIVWLPGQDLLLEWVGVSYPFFASHALAIDDVTLSGTNHPPAHPLDTWHLRHTVSGTSINGVAYGNGLFVAVSAHGHIFTSANGTSWSSQPAGISTLLHKIAWGEGRFVAVGAAGAIFTSDDGTNWTPRVSNVSNRLASICYGAGKFVAAAEGNIILVSDDGADWASYTPGQVIPHFITHGAGHFVVESSPRTNLVSSDAVNWYPLASGSSNNLYTIGSGGGTLVAIDTRNIAYASTDGTNWTRTGSTTILRPARIAFGNGCYVTVGGGPIEYSRDAATWHISAGGYLYVAADVAFGNGTFVAVGGGGNILQSDPVIALSAPNSSGLQIMGPVGSWFRIESRGDIGSANPWETEATIQLLQSPQQWTLPPATSAQRFFRAVMLTAPD